jgi:hypothetical protein
MVSGKPKNPHATGEEHRRRNGLHSKLYIGTSATQIVIDAETKNQAGGNIDTEKCRRGKALDELWEYKRKREPQAQADGECKEDGHSPEAGKRSLVNMPTVSWRRNPASAGCRVSHCARRHERHNQRERE